MRGSIAIWSEATPIEAAGYAPKIEAHINIWRNSDRKSGQGHFDLLDIGILFQEVRALRRLSISLPFTMDQANIIDLFEVMRDDTTLSAIFNETLEGRRKSQSEDFFEAFHTERKCVQCFVQRCRRGADWTLRKLDDGDDTGHVIVIGPTFFDRIRAAVGDHYLRLRVMVPIGQHNGFVSDNRPRDSAFLSTISTSEIIEFRLNEMRNFSTALRKELKEVDCRLIDISAVHYFLIRDMTVEMTQSHMNFRKMRRLEPRIWDNYLTGFPGFFPDRLIIYHWASFAKSTTEPVENFTALATFRARYTGSLAVYAAVIVALGALGSAAQAIGAESLKCALAWIGYSAGPISSNLLVVLLLATVLYGAVKFNTKNR